MVRAVDTFTVIVPVCNVARYLAATIDSLLVQSIGDWRAICVDDGSTDGSGRILDEYAARDARITVIHQANGGVSAARNVALNHATGDILAFLDPDDLVAPDWLAKLKAGIRDVDLVWGGMTRDDGSSVLTETPLDIGVVYRGDAVRQRVWRAVFGYRLRDLAWIFSPGGMWRHCRREYAVLMCRAIRRSILNDLRFDERVRYGEDMLFWAAVAKRTQSMRVIGDTGYHYFERPDGAAAMERRHRMTPYKFAARDIRHEIDPQMTQWRGSFLLSALEILRSDGIGTFWRYVTFK